MAFRGLVSSLRLTLTPRTASVGPKWSCVSHYRLYRAYSSEEGGDTAQDKDNSEQLEQFEGTIPREKLTISYTRSSGPGGQNVNKLNTKVQLRFHLDSADWLPDRVKERVHKLFSSKITKSGEVMVSSQLTRSQHLNTEDAIHKLQQMLSEASEVPRGPTGLSLARIKALKRRAHQRRLAEKKYLTLKKQSRQTETSREVPHLKEAVKTE